MRDTNTEKTLTDCQPPVGTNSQNIDPIPPRCDPGWYTQKRVAENPGVEWNQQHSLQKLGVQYLGQSGLCDPIQAGQIINDLDTPDREVIYRYTRAFRGNNEAMVDLFRNIKVLDEDGKAHIVPIIWASQERAVAALLQDNVRKDPTLVVDRIRLPIMAIWASNYALDLNRYTYQKARSLLYWWDCDKKAGFTTQEKYMKDTAFAVTRGLPMNITYTLYVWTLYQEDIDQILEQVMLKFSPVAYIRVKGVYWEIIVTMDSIGNNLDIEPGDKKQRVIKYQFTMTAKTYIPQPITRLKQLVNPFDEFKNINVEEIKELLNNLENTA